MFHLVLRIVGSCPPESPTADLGSGVGPTEEEVGWGRLWHFGRPWVLVAGGSTGPQSHPDSVHSRTSKTSIRLDPDL